MKRTLIIASIAAALTVTAVAQRPGRGSRGGPRGFETSSLHSPPLAKTAVEKKILGVLDEIVRMGVGFQSVPANDGRVLRLVTEAAGAKNVVEIGTSTGYSGLWLCLAMQATHGKLTTFEVDPRRATMAREHFKKAGVDHMVTLVEGDAHKNVARLKEPIDVLFIDADKGGYTDYLNKLLPLVRPGGLILAHNVTMASEYTKAIASNPDLDTVFYMEGHGLGITLKKR